MQIEKKSVVCVLALLTLTLQGCAFPRKDFTSLPGVEVIKVTRDQNGRYMAEGPDCNQLQEASQYHGINNARPSIAFGCATYSNLAASLARPSDLVSPKEFAGPQPDAAVLAVERYRLNTVEPLRNTESTSLTGN